MNDARFTMKPLDRSNRRQSAHQRMRRSRIVALLVLALATTTIALSAPTHAQSPQQDEDTPAQAAPTSAEPAQQPDDGEQAEPATQPPSDAENAGPILNPRITAEPEQATQVGRTSEFTVEFDLPEGFQWLSIRPIGNRFVEFLGNTELTKNGDIAQVGVTVVVYRSGEYTIDGFELTYVAPDGTQRQESTSATSINVQSVIANEQDPALAPPGPFRMVRTHNPVPLYVLGGALIALLGFILFRVFRKTEEEEFEIIPLRPAHELALEALDRLEARELLALGQHLEFHMILSAILREFVGRRYGFHAPEMTTTEIRTALRNRQKDVGSYAEEILIVLGETDVVKFAKGAPPVEESRQLFARTREIVEDIAARELQKPHEVPAPLSGDLPVGDHDEEPTYDSDVADGPTGEAALGANEDGPVRGVGSADDHAGLLDEKSPSTGARTPRATLPFGPPNTPKPRDRRVAPENVIAFGDRATRKEDRDD